MNLVSSFVDLVRQVSSVMTQPTFQSFAVLLTGWVFARRRTVTGMILAAGAVDTKHHSAFHRIFASAPWSMDELGLAVFRLILPWLGDGCLFVALDDTLARKRGLKVFARGWWMTWPICTRCKHSRGGEGAACPNDWTDRSRAGDASQQLCARFRRVAQEDHFHRLGR